MGAGRIKKIGHYIGAGMIKDIRHYICGSSVIQSKKSYVMCYLFSISAKKARDWFSKFSNCYEIWMMPSLLLYFKVNN